MKKLIAFTGLAGSGKTTAALWLIKEHSYKARSFATPIKKMIALIWPQCTEKNTAYPELGGKTLRQAYQLLGTEWGRVLMWDDLWVRQLVDSLSEHDYYVVDDLRFTNEAKGLKDAGAYIVEIRRPGTQKMDHASEQGIDPLYVDEVIINDGTPEDFIRKLKDVCS